MNKRNLQIQIDLDQESLEDVSPVTVSHSNVHLKIQATENLQKYLSCILARNFIECWEQLKNHSPENNSMMIINYFPPNEHESFTLDLGQKKIENQVRHSRYSQKNLTSRSKKRSGSYMQNQVKTNSFKKNKSVKSVKPQQYSRQKVLYQIADKLKYKKKSQETEITMLHKLEKLQKMMVQMKSQYHTQSRSRKPRDQNQQLFQKAKSQISFIKDEIASIKKENEQILKIEMMQSRQIQNQPLKRSPIYLNMPQNPQSIPLNQQNFRIHTEHIGHIHQKSELTSAKPMSYVPNQAPSQYSFTINQPKPYSITQNTTIIPNQIHQNINRTYHQARPVIHSQKFINSPQRCLNCGRACSCSQNGTFFMKKY